MAATCHEQNNETLEDSSLADLVLEGGLCSDCQRTMREPPGYPRRCRACLYNDRPSRRSTEAWPGIPCPGCARVFVGHGSLAQHRAAKGH